MLQKLPHDDVVPFQQSELSKKEQVEKMFDRIAKKYDLVNRTLSARVDISWRKKALQKLKGIHAAHILDMATGTADMAIMAAKMLKPKAITGIDLSEQMLEIGRKKVAQQNLQTPIELLKGDSEAISFPDDTFEAAMVAFGIRNFENLEKGLEEINRVLKPGGRLVILEFSKPRQPVLFFYTLYMQKIVPFVASLLKQNKEAYLYLNKSSNAFVHREALVNILNKIGFIKSTYQSISLGICCIYVAEKK